jgi:hypothetical protein
VTVPSPQLAAIPEIALFDGMAFRIYNEDYDPPHVDVTVDGTIYRFSLYGQKPLGEPTPSAKVSKQVKDWLRTEIPSSARTINELVYDRWLKTRNGQPVENVYTPDEIKAMRHPKGTKATKKASSRNSYYAIERIETLHDFHVRVWFANGDVKIVDVKAMRGHNEMFASVWRNFNQAKSEICMVSWPVMSRMDPTQSRLKTRISGALGWTRRHLKAEPV